MAARHVIAKAAGVRTVPEALAKIMVQDYMEFKQLYTVHDVTALVEQELGIEGQQMTVSNALVTARRDGLVKKPSRYTWEPSHRAIMKFGYVSAKPAVKAQLSLEEAVRPPEPAPNPNPSIVMEPKATDFKRIFAIWDNGVSEGFTIEEFNEVRAKQPERLAGSITYCCTVHERRKWESTVIGRRI